ncbi:uncharacterized protein IL334_007756 [Kwoniella shivajii]|uniref:Uncharacterized protein n=1 Tax=Kwoniella shivajii TaxID=564305 RepID=A0ABZ1DAY6_9TREE|nr:hypothetical protein IL334_007756 [Kwoniella shivajii]
MPPSPTLPTLTLSLPPLPLIPTSPPLIPPTLDKRQTYVTVSVVKNTTDSDTSSSSSSNSSSGFPIKIAIPALIGGMALALIGFGIWWWWTRKIKRERRAAWEARQRKKRKRAEQSARPSISSSRAPSGSGSKSPMEEKSFIPPVPALPKHAATQDPYKERGYGYSDTSAQPSFPPSSNQLSTSINSNLGSGAGAFGYATQPGLEQDLQYGYDQYGQPISQGYNNNNNNPQEKYRHQRSKSNDSSNPANPFSNTNSAAPVTLAAPINQKEEQGQAQPLPVKNEKSSKRAMARMKVADSAAANASADPAYRHQPKKPSPLAIAAAEAKAKQLAESNNNNMEHLAPPNESSLPPYESQGQGNNDSRGKAVSGEWGVALGSPNNDGHFNFNSQQPQVEQEDPYLKAQKIKSGLYTQDPYAAYHGDYNDDDEDVYHQAAEGMGLASNGIQSSTPKKSRWV